MVRVSFRFTSSYFQFQVGQFSSFYFFNIWFFFKSLFWMKQIQGSVRVKINPLTAEWALRALVDFTLSNARRFYSSNGEPLGRERVKEYVHAWSEFVFVSLLLIFNFFPQINHFYYFTSLHGLQDVENHCPHLRDIELKSGRKNHYLRFPHVYVILYIIGLVSMKLQN